MARTRKGSPSQRKVAYWRKQVEKWRESDLGQAEYSRLAGVSVKSFGYWKRRFDREELAKSPSPVIVAVKPFLPAVELKPLMLHAKNGFRLEIHNETCSAILEKTIQILARLI